MIRRVPSQVVDREWVQFPGGELEGVRPRVLCRVCRERLEQQGAAPRRADERRRPPLLCFQCYRAELDRERALQAAGQLDTASDARFQTTLPFEPVDVGRLERLRAERADARASMQTGVHRFVDKRRQAQIAARHALSEIAARLHARGAASSLRGPLDRLDPLDPVDNDALADAVHAAELQLPEAWLPFVVSR
jgi:hypothetical protein